MAAFMFKYESEGFGWARVKMCAGAQSIEFHASYIGRNPMESMLEALVWMKFEDDDSRFYMSSEPGELRVTMEKNGDDVHIQVDECDQFVSDYHQIKEGQWAKKLETTVLFDRLIEVVIKEAERNLLLHGLVGFSEDWCGHMDVFPMSAYLRLKGVDFTVEVGAQKRSSLTLELTILQDLLR